VDITRDDILDNVTLYWLTNTAVSSARLYWEAAQGAKGGFFDPRNVAIPVAVSAFPDEIYAAPQSWAERAYPKLIHYNKRPKAVTLQPGNNRRPLLKNCDPHSDHCVINKRRRH